MTRRNLLFRGVGIGYLSMAAGMLYSFLSIPLALSYLGKSEYGLWSLVMTITGYLNFTEFGLSNSIQRHLLEVKDQRPNPAFGGVFLAGTLSFCVIGMFSILVGLSCVPFLPGWIGIPQDQKVAFGWLLTGTIIVFGFTLMTRILGAPLYVFQRFDIYETGNILLFGVWMMTLYAGLRLGCGVYSLLISQAAGWAFSTVFNLISCSLLGIYPKREEWSIPSRTMICEIALFSRDSFLQQTGQQVVASLPVLIITRTLGLDAAAIWTVGVRPFFILHQLLRRPFQYAFTMLADTFANLGACQAMNPWIRISRLTTIGSMVVFPTCVIFNADFMRLWTHGKIAWSFQEAWVCGLYFLLLSILNSFYGMVGINKKIGIIRFSSLGEGLLIVISAACLCPRFGLVGLLSALLISKVLLGVIPTVVYLREVFGAEVKKVWRDTVLLPLRIFPFICGTAWLPVLLLQRESGWLLVILCGMLSLMISGLLGMRFGGGYHEVRSFLETVRLRIAPGSRRDLASCHENRTSSRE